MTSFSVIIPAFNAEANLADCLSSALTQDFDAGNFEVLLIDDCSTDGTHDLALASVADFPALRVMQTPANGGPGIARNLGIAHARGQWILFLDSDDALVQGALSRLAAFLALPEQTDCDVVGFDWHHADHSPDFGARRDQRAAVLDKRDLLHRYLSLQMDGSVIYTAIRRTLLLEHGLVFAAGYHEDVDYLFKAYWQARRIGFLEAVLYAKRRRAGSIAETISTRHLDGFLRAWRGIGEFLRDASGEDFAAWRPSYRIGLLGLLATRVREICQRTDTPEAAAILYAALYAGWQSLDGSVDLGATPTQYSQIAHCFVTAMETSDSGAVARAARITSLVKEIMGKTWSCTDLHHSVFLAPDQVRTCCRRFFVDGEIRGDVVLLDTANAPAVTGARISAAKQKLHTAINRGDVTDCSGCPFLEFKEWGPIQPARIRLLSFEYHSVCNLKCTYCSDTYYGGVKQRYDVQGLVDGFIAQGALDPAVTVVWGGGEPVVDEKFTPIIDALVSRLPGVTQRVLTNSVTYSATVARLLAADRIAITTSIDAGTRETFTQIRGSDRLDRVVGNLQKYANANPAKVTVKYIFTEGNQSLDECRAFVELMRGAGLLQCNFQISYDFKSETVDAPALVSIIALYSALVAAGCQVVYFDDLLRQRLAGMDSDMEASVRRQLAALGLDDVLIEANGPMDLAIWGAGWQAKYLLANASFFKHAKPAFLVDSTPSKIGSKFMGIAVRDPRELMDSDIPVLIAAVQGYPAIYREFLSLGLSPSRLITKVVI